MKSSDDGENERQMNQERREPGEGLGAAFEELAQGVADALNKKEFIAAIAEHVKCSARRKRMSPWLGASFSVLVLCGIGFLGYLKVISSEATTGLLSAVLGVWFGQGVRRA
jgi:hypothetical protein